MTTLYLMEHFLCIFVCKFLDVILLIFIFKTLKKKVRPSDINV